ncbi:Transcription factor GRAS [Melia azedarach]|uniref:Transcription factor GRAS n=1 Tax=Melia azedarach TaxID=155640 RepID=A0ACC1XI14_MELAZ|nr:Transcription factor GRAS [Melia azedarach]
MAPDFQCPRGFYLDDKNNEVIGLGLGLDLNFSAAGFYSFFDDSTSESSSCTWSISDETRDQKRLKKTPVNDESNGSNSSRCSGGNNRITGSLNTLPRLQFRDHIWAYTQRYSAIEAMEEAALAMMGGEETEVKDQGNGDGMKLVQQLIACAEAVACRDKVHASALLSELRANALVFGTSFQRVASCFVQGLSDRLALVQSLGAVGVVGPITKSMAVTSEKAEALSLVYEICPQIQFGHFIANASILEAFEGESLVHVVDLGMTLGLPLGHQWRNLMHSLTNRSGKPPTRLRITGVGNCTERLQSIGDELKGYADSLKLKFEFLIVEKNVETLQAKDINVQNGEVLVINSILHLHCVVKESRGALNSVLQRLNKLSPKVFILAEQDSSHNGPFFLGRFMEALHYYSAIFDSLDAMLPKYDTRRAKMEQFFFAEEIKNIVSCEGPARVERHERVDQWRRRMSRAGFQSVPIRMIIQAKQWLKKFQICEGYTIIEEKGCLVLGWKSKPIIAVSCWKCS